MIRTGRFFAVVIVGWAVLSSISFGYSGWIAGKTGNALAFDGANDYVEVPGYYGIGGSSARTVSLWIKTSASGSPQALLQWGSDAAGQLWYLRVESDGKVFMSAYATGVKSSLIVTDNQWHHIAAVLDEGQTDPTQIRLYIDGQLDAVPTGTGTINTTQDVSVHLGVWYRPNAGSLSNYFTGLMDEVCIYGRALDASEILPEAPIPTEGLIAHWAMDEVQGVIAHDSVSLYDGSLRNIYMYSGGSGTTDDPYQISNADDLLDLAEATEDYSDSFILTADIDMGGQTFIAAIIAPDMHPYNYGFQGNPFTGSFDGNQKKIKNIRIDTDGADYCYLGLFGEIYGSATHLKNLWIENAIIIGGTHSQVLGGLCGENSNATISNCHVTASVNGRMYLGGLCGGNIHGTINNCCTFGSVNGDDALGGLCGMNAGLIKNCYTEVSVTGLKSSAGFCNFNHTGTIDNCYSAGFVSGGQYKGGFCVNNFDGSITNCFWDTQTSGQATSAGGTGKTTDEMKRQTMFTSAGWDFGTWITGKIDNALFFDGVDDYVGVPGYTGIGGTSARTVSLWVKTSTTGIYQALVQWGADTTGQVWLLRIQTDGKVLAAAYGGGVTSSRVVTDNQWHHIAAVLDEGQTDSNQIRLYIDGQPDAVPTGSGTINTSQTVSVHLGAWYQSSSGSTTNYFNGLIDEVCIYGRALDASEIEPEAPIPTEGLVSHWAMDETEGTVVHDSVSSYDGELKNSVNSAVWSICEGTNYPRLVWQIPEGDFTCPDGVSVEDLDYFVGRWLMENCTADNHYCGGVDVDMSGNVDLGDWAVFAEHWLEGM